MPSWSFEQFSCRQLLSDFVQYHSQIKSVVVLHVTHIQERVHVTSYRCMPLLTTDQLVLPEICLFRSTSMEFGCQEAGGCLQFKNQGHYSQ
jgi:hypothetical protein